ncbi:MULTISPECIES: alkaline phosphatase [Arthrobacter]|uniref:Alkaline phosphatase n=2 Tax=Arthrobacter TaxID=1663 RepID=A0ABU9KGE0_9MICC|nr:alkaline phosphatase [Arthrobacter sp. YJM1]MDP5225971.1 alkaline phosphatase [Arthrobacter sp. YJM1]
MSNDRPESNGLSRRNLFRATGGSAAAVAIVGLGEGAAQATATQTANVAGLKAVGPHAFTARTVGAEIRGAVSGPIRILPLNRAKFLAGARFDLRVEASRVDPATARIEISVSGPKGPAAILAGEPVRTSNAADSLEVTYRQLSYPYDGDFTVRVRVTSGGNTTEFSVQHEVVLAKTQGRKARNVIFFLGDGMGQGAITGARILSKGITEGKYNGLLEMDQMEARGIISTSGSDSIATDSANSMHAYMTGHKSAVNALGVYESNATDVNKHPRVETMAELLKRSKDMAIGVVTTAEIQDATPAAVMAHTRRRSEYIEIMDQILDPVRTPDVLMGGGMAYLIPQSQKGSKRKDERNLINEFRTKGFAVATNATELQQAVKGRAPEKLLGQFQMSHLNVYLDRAVLKDPKVLGDWKDQPKLTDMTAAALKVLSKKPNGFFLMVEGASIDKQEHPMDGPRALYDTIEFDQAIGLAKKWAAENGEETLIVVCADHNHSMSIVGTHDRRKDQDRPANGVYGEAGFPTYTDGNGDGFPDDPNPEIGLFFGWNNHPDHTDHFLPNPVPVQPSLLDASGKAVPNPAHQPGGELQQGNLPYTETNCVHCVDDVALVASGPGSADFNRFHDNTEVFFSVVNALGLKVPTARQGGKAQDSQAGNAQK